MHAAEIVDAAASDRVLVVGSLPPHGRDLDVLVDPRAQTVIGAALDAAGFEQHGESWIRFAECSAFAVDLIPWSEWDLPAGELQALFSDAEPVPGRAHLVRPAPRHALLILARRLARERRSLRAKHERRIRDELERDPDAWAGAEAVAAEWRAGAALERLRARFDGRASPVRVRRPRLGGVVALSGLDGAGKSTQAEALAAALDRLGFETERAWVPLGSSETLQRVARAGKRSLRRGGSGGDDRLLWNPGGRAGRRSPAVEAAAAAWSTAGSVANGIAHLRAAAAAAARGKVVIFDRYVLDTIVHLRFTYGGAPHPTQERLVLALSPTPVAAYLLELAPDAAHARKQDWDLEFLEAQATLYRSQAERLGVRRLDATRPRDELAAEIAREVWLRLSGP